MEPVENCRGPLCPLTALYGPKKGAEIYTWLQERLAGFSIFIPQYSPIDQGDTFLVLPVSSGLEFPLANLPETPARFSGLQLIFQEATHPLPVEESRLAELARDYRLMISFGWQIFSAGEYRQVVEDLLLAARSGVSFLHLDAARVLSTPGGIDFLSRLESLGTVQLIRRTLDEFAPNLNLVVGEDASQAENLLFFNSGGDVQMVENLALAPLLLHALGTGQARFLTEWAASLSLPFPGLTFYNTFGFPDRLSLKPVEGILPKTELVQLSRRNPGVSGFASGLASLHGCENAAVLHQRMHLAQGVLLALTGLPGFDLANLPEAILLRGRAGCPAFHPFGAQLVIEPGNPAVFALLRISPDGRSLALCLHNFSPHSQAVHLERSTLGLPAGSWSDLISRCPVNLGRKISILMEGYQVLWLTPSTTR